MYLRDVDIKASYKDSALAKSINFGSDCIEELYLKCLGRNKLFTGNFAKAVVSIQEYAKDELKLNDMVDVIEINKSFDFDYYLSISKQEKKKMLLDALQFGLLEIAGQKEWDINPLLDAYNCCVVKNLKHEYWLKGKYFKAPDKKHYAGVYCIHDLDYFACYIVFFDSKKNEILRKKILNTKKSYRIPHFHKLGWERVDIFFISGTTYVPIKEHLWKAKIDDKNLPTN